VSPSIREEVAKTGTSSIGAKTEASPGPKASNEVLVASRQLPAVPRADPNRLVSTNRASQATNATPSAPAATQPSVTPPSVPSNRFGYPYANFDVPAQGNRAEAVRLLTEGINAQRAYRIRDALERYRSAAVADPSLFEAHYNRGVAAFEAGELGESLRAYERALSINETSVPARFNFATALEKSGYPEAAVHELELLVAAHPEEVRAHLALGNLQARRFGDRARAREHYRKVLELNPQHPEAGTLRFWIEANP
jgi:tetratricopeptide (TPR) repeat protein